MTPNDEIRAGWRCLTAALVGTALGAPTLPFYTIGVFAPTLAHEFSWSLATIFGGLTLNMLILLVAGPIAGHLIDRLGARIVAAASLAGLGIGYAALALSSGSVIQYYLTWAFLSLASAGATSISFTRAINGTFTIRRGLALGIALCGIGLCALIVKPIAGKLPDLAGWRVTMLVIGLLPVLIAAPAALWGLPGRDPALATQPDRHSPAQAFSLTPKAAIRTRAFVTLACAFPVIAFANGAPIPHLENILRSTHIDARQILGFTSSIGIALIAGRLVGGWLLDRVWAPLVGVAVSFGAAIGCWLLAQQSVQPAEAIAAILLLGFCGGIEGDLLAYLVARYFGVRNYGTLYGALFGLFAIGAGAGPSLIGYGYDQLGSYTQILGVCALLLVLAGMLLLTLGRYP